MLNEILLPPLKIFLEFIFFPPSIKKYTLISRAVENTFYFQLSVS